MNLLESAAAFADAQGVPPSLTWIPTTREARDSLLRGLGHALLVLEGRSRHLPGLLFVYHLEAEAAFLARELPILSREPGTLRRFFLLDTSGTPAEVSLDQALTHFA